MEIIRLLPGIEDLWAETRGDARVLIAILDGLVDRSHPSLRGARLIEIDELGLADTLPSHHGTYITSLIFGQHNGSIAGVAPQSSGLLIPIFSEGSSGCQACSQQDLGRAIQAAVRAGAHVINISAGDLSPDSPLDPTLEEAVRHAAGAGVLIVASAGNHGEARLQVPGALPGVLAVGATNASGDPLSSSNWAMTCVSCGVIAPGEAVVGARPGNGTVVETGTSCAAALVTGVAALLASMLLKYGRNIDTQIIREVLIVSASKRSGDGASVLSGRLNVRGATELLRRKLGARPSYYIKPEVLKGRYKGVTAEKFGTTDVLLPDGRSYNVADLWYSTGKGLGMRFVPVSDEPEMEGWPTAGHQLIDELLREEMGLKQGDPIFAVLSYIRPEEHRSELLRLADGQKLRRGHQHIGAYLGTGRTSHIVPAKSDWKGQGPLNMNWNVDRYPANVQVVSLHGAPQVTFNRNSSLVNSILATTSTAPRASETLRCRTVDINTTLQFYRDSIRRADYLDDLPWFTNCAAHMTIVLNTSVNLPHNPASFRQVFGADGEQLWEEFRRRYEEVNGCAFTREDETYFEPLWRLAGFTADEIRPLSVREYNRYQAALAERRLDEYTGRKPLNSGKAQAWPLETVVDVISRFLEAYADVRQAGGVYATAVLLELRHKTRSMLGLSESAFMQLVKPIATALLLVDAMATGQEAAVWRGDVSARLERLAGASGESIRPMIDACVKGALQSMLDMPAEQRRPPPQRCFELAVAPALVRLREISVSGDAGAGYFSTPSIVYQIGQGLHPCSPFIKVRTVCTVMDKVELVYGVRTQTIAGEKGNSMAEMKSAADIMAVSRSGGTVEAAACECGGKGSQQPLQLLYALGTIDYDFPSESRLNSIRQKMRGESRAENPRQLLEYLDANPFDAPAIQWVLKLDNTPIYSIEPAGPFAREAYDLLRRFMREQIEAGVERVSLPGVITGSRRLSSGTVVPSAVPEVRGMYNWTTDALLSALTGPESDAKKPKQERESRAAGVRNFLSRVYYQTRNMGRTPAERALNFAATNAFEVASVFEQVIREEMDLDTIEVVKSPISSVGSDEWDVRLVFFYPQRQVQTVRKVYSFTVDVADVVPSTVGQMRSWFIR